MRGLLLVLVALGLLALAPVAQAGAAPRLAAPVLGVGEQKSSLFDSPHFARLDLGHVRYIAAWDALRSDWQRRELDDYMAAAERAGVRVLLGFGHSRRPGREEVAPAPAEFRRELRRFLQRYPAVTEVLTWNEANHASQPTWRRPERAAAYFDIVTEECRGCKVVAADVLDWPNMRSWLRAFRRHARHTPRIWGLHNYIDANRFQTKGTRSLLGSVRGEIWFTETGGLIERRTLPTRGRVRVFRHTPSHAARAMSWVMKLAGLSSRVKRVYVYHWAPGERGNRWDSALLDRRGRPRPAYHVLRRWALGTQAARRAGRAP